MKVLYDSVLPLNDVVHEGDAGIDLPALEVVEINGFTISPEKSLVVAPANFACVRTGVRFKMEKNMVGIIKGRSGYARRSAITVAGGVIDSGYTGEVHVIVINNGHWPFHIERGMKIAQVVFHRLPAIELVQSSYEVWETTTRGENGFGSTGA